MIDDAELLRRYAEERSEDAFAELVRRHLSLVYHAALRQLGGNTAAAEEVAQVVFTDVARKAGQLSRRPVLANWLHRSTRFAAAKLRRAERTRTKYETEAETMHAMLRNDEVVADWEQLRPVIDEVLQELDEQDQSAVLMRFFESKPFAVIGDRLGVSADGARMRVDRALERLQVLLARRGVASTTSAMALLFANSAAGAIPAGLASSVTGAAIAAQAAGSWASFLALMKAPKTSLCAAAVFLVTIGVTVTLQDRSQAALRSEITELRAQQAGLRNMSVSKSTAVTTSSNLTAELRDLQQRAALLQVAMAVPGGSQMKPQNTWRNAGRGTPEDAFETSLWAVFHEDWDVLATVAHFTPEGKAKLDAFFENLPAEVKAKYRTPERLVAPLYAGQTIAGSHFKLAADMGWGRGNIAYRVMKEEPARATVESVKLYLMTNFGPVQPEGDLQVMVSRKDDGWSMFRLGDEAVDAFIKRIDPATGDILPVKP